MPSGSRCTAPENLPELAHWCRDLLDNLAAGLPERELRKLETAFLASSRYEWLFWEMAWKMKQWPI